MKKTALFLFVISLFTCLPGQAAKKQKAPMSEREYWCQEAYKMAQPVL